MCLTLKMMVFLQKMFQLNMQEFEIYCPQSGATFWGVKVPVPLDKNPQRIVIKIPCPSSKQLDDHETAPLTAQRTPLSKFGCSAVIPKELAK